MHSITRSALRTVLSSLTALAILTLVVLGVTTAQGVASPSATPTTSAADPTPAPAARAADLRELRADLAAARKLEGSARVAAIADIRKRALAGDYGAAVERRAERRLERRDVIRALLPDELQADLAKLDAAPADQKLALRAEIKQKALAGGYGPKVAEAAKKLQELRGH